MNGKLILMLCGHRLRAPVQSAGCTAALRYE